MLTSVFSSACKGCLHLARMRNPLDVLEEEYPCFECFCLYLDGDDPARPYWERGAARTVEEGFITTRQGLPEA